MMKKQDGNALWIILIAIALIGMLTAMFSRSSDTSEDTGDFERASIRASEVMRHGKSIQLAIQQLIQRGCSENTISFWYDSDGDGDEDGDDTYYNDEAPDNHSCHLFATEGAGLGWPKPPAPFGYDDPLWNEGKYFFVSGTAWEGIGTNCTSASCADLILILRNLDKGTCEQINRTMGISGIPEDTAWGAEEYTGGYSYVTTLADEPEGTAAVGKTAACFYTVASDIYSFNMVLHDR